jgi:hypothetical protein
VDRASVFLSIYQHAEPGNFRRVEQNKRSEGTVCGQALYRTQADDRVNWDDEGEFASTFRIFPESRLDGMDRLGAREPAQAPDIDGLAIMCQPNPPKPIPTEKRMT